MSVLEALDGSPRELLVALMRNLARAIDRTENDAARAAMARQLRDLRGELESLDAAENGDDVGNAAALPDEEWPAT